MSFYFLSIAIPIRIMVGARALSPNGNDLYMIANNYLPNTDFVFDAHPYERAIGKLENPADNLEYFALIGGERTPGTHLCIANPKVQDLIYQDMLDYLDLGYDATHLGQQDGFRACQCEACRELFETGDDWGEKLWCLHRKLAERLLVDRPDKTVIILSYGHTWAPPKTFKEFPANTSVMLCRMADDLMAQWAECTVPRGYMGYYAAAFREAMLPMRRFFDTLHHAVQFYADRPGSYTDVYGRSRAYLGRDDALRLIGFLYSPDVLADLDTHLSQAERRGKRGHSTFLRQLNGGS